jgi:hypothetical protein
MEYELLDTRVFDQDRYFDVFVEYAKASPEDLLIQISVYNRGPEAAEVHVAPAAKRAGLALSPGPCICLRPARPRSSSRWAPQRLVPWKWSQSRAANWRVLVIAPVSDKFRSLLVPR